MSINENLRNKYYIGQVIKIRKRKITMNTIALFSLWASAWVHIYLYLYDFISRDLLFASLVIVFFIYNALRKTIDAYIEHKEWEIEQLQAVDNPR